MPGTPTTVAPATPAAANFDAIQAVGRDLVRALREPIAPDTLLEVTADTQLDPDEVLCHRAMLDAARLDPFLATPLAGQLASASTVDPHDGLFHVHVHARTSRGAVDLTEFYRTLEDLYYGASDSAALAARMQSLLDYGDDADCTLVVEDTTGAPIYLVTAHRFVLAARSPYFEAIFGPAGLGGLARTTTAHRFRLPLAVFGSPALFDNVLTFIYTGAFRTPPASALQAFELFHCSQFLAMPALQAAVIAGLRILLHGFTCSCASCCATLPSVLLFAEHMGATDLCAELVPAFSRAPAKLWTSLEFLNFPPPIKESIFRTFLLEAEHNGAALLDGIMNLDAVLVAIQGRAGFHELTMVVAHMCDALVPQLLRNLPYILGTIDRAPVADMPHRIETLRAHLVPQFHDGNIVLLAFNLFTLCQSRAGTPKNASESDTDGHDDDDDENDENDGPAGEIHAARHHRPGTLGDLADDACTFLASRWPRIALTPPRGVYATSGAWRAFLEHMATRCHVPVREFLREYGGMGGGSANAAGLIAPRPVSLVGLGQEELQRLVDKDDDLVTPAVRKPRVRSMYAEVTSSSASIGSNKSTGSGKATAASTVGSTATRRRTVAVATAPVAPSPKRQPAALASTSGAKPNTSKPVPPVPASKPTTTIATTPRKPPASTSAATTAHDKTLARRSMAATTVAFGRSTPVPATTQPTPQTRTLSRLAPGTLSSRRSVSTSPNPQEPATSPKPPGTLGRSKSLSRAPVRSRTDSGISGPRSSSAARAPAAAANAPPKSATTEKPAATSSLARRPSAKSTTASQPSPVVARRLPAAVASETSPTSSLTRRGSVASLRRGSVRAPTTNVSTPKPAPKLVAPPTLKPVSSSKPASSSSVSKPSTSSSAAKPVPSSAVAPVFRRVSTSTTKRNPSVVSIASTSSTSSSRNPPAGSRVQLTESPTGSSSSLHSSPSSSLTRPPGGPSKAARDRSPLRIHMAPNSPSAAPAVAVLDEAANPIPADEAVSLDNIAELDDGGVPRISTSPLPIEPTPPVPPVPPLSSFPYIVELARELGTPPPVPPKDHVGATRSPRTVASMSPRTAASMSPRTAASLSPRTAPSLSPRTAPSLSPRTSAGGVYPPFATLPPGSTLLGPGAAPPTVQSPPVPPKDGRRFSTLLPPPTSRPASGMASPRPASLLMAPLPPPPPPSSRPASAATSASSLGAVIDGTKDRPAETAAELVPIKPKKKHKSFLARIGLGSLADPARGGTKGGAGVVTATGMTRGKKTKE
ncbi:hypothetical protein AMAG_10132 [Allomyces macrogynus ATCC 38327]|uniref:BTB domain-containing protein n=1 Tax=Allomyces macrogynus (strain ATCC 38327) TaxID=578462 RepID=A0A0L0SQY8_ALLM3|nr:hypothetical protein AMAG_10132 [Allomyces macrogynus ATCC 38327]|eukprot:KNE64789.1 hypothetical protein AMAG_10132 [Allomyces macrogynus ATCC 38327]